MKKTILALALAVLMCTPIFAAQAGKVSTSSLPLNVRSAPGGRVITSLAKGSNVTLISKSGSWWYARYGENAYGYLSAAYITPLGGEELTVTLSSGSLNVRTGGGMAYRVIDRLYNGERVVRLSQSNGWSRVLYDGGKVGYLSSAYLSSGAQKYPSVSLSVPLYRQTDARWSSVRLGSSGKSMASIGCTTCSVAMCESYRLGKTVRPDSLAAEVSYTSGGALYWPSNYAMCGPSGYLSEIYELLSEGKPVILGAKNASGGTHWIVVTGFKGGSTLSSSAFTINDPGSAGRTTLAQFLSAYPTLMRIVWYK